MRRIDCWLARHRIARVINSCYPGNSDSMEVNMHARPWTPRWVVVGVGQRYFLKTHTSSASRLRLDQVKAGRPAADGTRHWQLRYAPSRAGAR